MVRLRKSQVNRWHMDKRKLQRSLLLIQPEGFLLDFNGRNNIHVLLRKENSFSKKQKSAKRGVNMVADFFVQRIFCRHSRKEKEDNSEILGII